MIETLHALASEAGMKSINVSLQSESSTQVALTVQCIPYPTKDKADESTLKLRDALATPIIVKGLPGEVEAKFGSLISEFKKTVTPRIRSLETQLDVMNETANDASKPDSEAKDTTVSAKLDDAEAAESRFTDSKTDSL